MEKTVVVLLRCTAMVKVPVLNPTNLHWKHWRFCNNMEKVACHVKLFLFTKYQSMSYSNHIVSRPIKSHYHVTSISPTHDLRFSGHIPGRVEVAAERRRPHAKSDRAKADGKALALCRRWKKSWRTSMKWGGIMHWIGFFCIMDGSLTVGNFLSEGFLKKNVLNITGFFEGQIVALKSMDKIEPLQTQKAWCWGSYLWNLSCDFNIPVLQAHFRLNASFNASIRLIRPNLSSPTVSRKGWGVGDTLDVKCHIMSYKKDWYVMYWIYLSTFQCCCCCCFLVLVVFFLLLS